MNRPRLLLPIVFGLFGAAVFASAQDATPVGGEVHPTKASDAVRRFLQVKSGAVLEGRLRGAIPFESIAGVLTIPGARIHGITFDADGARILLADGSAISGTFAQKSLPFSLFIGDIDIPLDRMAYYGDSPVIRKSEAVVNAETPQGDLFQYETLEGDSFKSIATSFITTVHALQEVNPTLKGNNLKPGTIVYIPPLK